MTEGPSIQRKSPHKGAADGFGFEGRRRVPVAMPVIQDDEPETEDTRHFDVEVFLDLLITGTRTTAEIGERAEILAFLLPNVRSRAKSLRELGLRLGVSHVTAAARLTRLRQCFQSDLCDLLTKEPSDDA